MKLITLAALASTLMFAVVSEEVHVEMTDPHGTNGIFYLHENHIDQPNVGLNIPGPYMYPLGMFVDPDFHGMLMNLNLQVQGCYRCRPVVWNFGTFFDGKQNNKSKPWKV